MIGKASKRKQRLKIVVAVLLAIAFLGWTGTKVLLAGAFQPGPSSGPFSSDDTCPTFKPSYPQCEVIFGNSGLSVLGSVYETFVGEGPFEIYKFDVESRTKTEFEIVATSNRGPLRSSIKADKKVRLGQDREDEKVVLTHQSSYCDAGRIYEQQVGYIDGEINVQNLEFWSAGQTFYFRLFQNGSPTAEVRCQ